MQTHSANSTAKSARLAIAAIFVLAAGGGMYLFQLGRHAVPEMTGSIEVSSAGRAEQRAHVAADYWESHNRAHLN